MLFGRRIPDVLQPLSVQETFRDVVTIMQAMSQEQQSQPQQEQAPNLVSQAREQTYSADSSTGQVQEEQTSITVQEVPSEEVPEEEFEEEVPEEVTEAREQRQLQEEQPQTQLLDREERQGRPRRRARHEDQTSTALTLGLDDVDRVLQCIDELDEIALKISEVRQKMQQVRTEQARKVLQQLLNQLEAKLRQLEETCLRARQ